jgi:predicted aspartyl protease
MKRPLPNSHSFTIKFNGLVNRIITEIGVSEAFDQMKPPTNLPKVARVQALWDTGATQSVITKDTAEKLGLKPVGVTKVIHAGGTSDCNTHLVNLILPNNVTVQGLLVSENADIVGHFGAIIGMDIINHGDLALTNASGQTWLSFRIPSASRTDFVNEFNQQLRSSIGPNEPCYCGSGRKFKKCHAGK